MPSRLVDLPNPSVRPVPRYSKRGFPAYRYVPGLQPHPTRDALGHSYRVPSNRTQSWHSEDWRTLAEWLYGVDLFNWFYFWEAHEAWEGLWSAVPRESSHALFLQGLIQLAAALLKIHMGVLDGARVLSTGGLEKLDCAAREFPQLLGLDIAETTSAFRTYFAPLHERQLPGINATVPVLRLNH